MCYYGATIANGNGGSGFNKGDVLLVPSLGTNPVGINGILTVSEVLSRKKLKLITFKENLYRVLFIHSNIWTMELIKRI